jgi:hypothetical protein
MATIVTGVIPKVIERTVLDTVGFGEQEDVPDIRKFIEKRDKIPSCARFTTTHNKEWGTTELRWIWYEVEL